MMAGISTVINHLAIAVDRLFAVTRPSLYSAANANDDRSVLTKIFLTWTVSLGVSSLQLVADFPQWPETQNDMVRCTVANVSRRNSL